VRGPWFNVVFAIVAAIAIVAIQYFVSQTSQIAPIPYSQFEQLLQQDKVASAGVSDRFVQGTLKEALPGGQKRFITTRVDPDIAGQLQQHGVQFTGEIEGTWLRDLLAWLVPTALLAAVWIYLGRRASQALGGGLMAIGKSKAKVYVESDTGVRFDDVAGVDEAKDELREVVDFLKDPTSYSRLGGRMPKGILLVGPPGTGKTLLAKAVAGQAKVPFYSISGSEFVEMFVGVGAARVRDLFQQARARAPAIIFIDELDALGRARGIGPYMGGHDEKEQTLNQLLVEMDGFDSRSGLVIVAATNRPEILDPALLRAGRFDRQVLVDRPDKKGRIQILFVHTKKVRLAANVDLEKVAALTPGFTGADLANLVNEAALLATRRGSDSVMMADFGNAVERIVAGLEKRNRLLNPWERQIVAHHEMGHAVVAFAMPGADRVHKVSIIPRGIGSLGYTIQRPTDDRFLMTKQELENKIAVLLGGRAAELVVFNHLSTGAADDLQRATDIARSMVTRYGMSEKLGSMAYERDPRSPLLPSGAPLRAHEHDYAEATAKTVDDESKRIIDDALRRARIIIEQRRIIFEQAAQQLLNKETIEEAELIELIGPPAGPPLREAAE